MESARVYSMMSALTVAAERPGTAATARLTPQELCESYSATICRFAAMAAGSELEAEDLAQEAMLKAVRNLDRFDPSKGAIDAWLWRIVANVAKDLHRGHARRVALWQRLVSLWHVPAQSVEERALQAITNDELIAAMRTLTDRDRLLIALRFGADLDLKTLGAAVGLSPDTAGQAVLRALSRLRGRLEVTR
jgi:RNA polymerase sigma-70 factor, ECF subfamily